MGQNALQYRFVNANFDMFAFKCPVVYDQLPLIRQRNPKTDSHAIRVRLTMAMACQDKAVPKGKVRVGARWRRFLARKNFAKHICMYEVRLTWPCKSANDEFPR